MDGLNQKVCCPQGRMHNILKSHVILGTMAPQKSKAQELDPKVNGYHFVEKEKKHVDVWRYKPYNCVVKVIDVMTGRKIIVLNEDQAKGHDIYSGYRTQVNFGKKSFVATVDTSSQLVKHGEVGVFRDVAKEFDFHDGDQVELVHLNRPDSIACIKKKLDGGSLSDKEVQTVVDEIMNNELSEAETSAWVTAAYIRGFTDDEIVALTYATMNSGQKLNLGKKVVLDKHCVGGVAGNRTTMVVVPMIAAAGYYIPKTSSRSITSAAGTADTMETLAEVTFSIEEMKSIVLKSYGAMVWGGGMALAPVDDRLIKIRHPLSLDPEGMLLASILGKKKSVGATHVLIDIPVGRGAKIASVERAQQLAQHFKEIGKRIDMKMEIIITDGAEPVGNGIGPGLECFDVLSVLSGKGPEDLRHKSIVMTGKLLESVGACSPENSYAAAEKLITSGKALKKMREIIGLQGGNENVKLDDLPIGKYTYDFKSNTNGQIFHIDNKAMSKIARIAGAPRDKGAGVYLHKTRGARVTRGDKIFTIHAESESKLSFAVKALEDLEPVEMRKMLLETIQ